MKKILCVFLLGALSSCWYDLDDDDAPKPKKNNEDYEKIDSIIQQAKQSYTEVANANQASDTMISNKVEKTAQTISHLETQVTQLTKENHELKAEIKNLTDGANNAGQPFRLVPISH